MKIQLLIAAGLLSFNVCASDSPFYLGVGIGETDFDDGEWTKYEAVPIYSDADGQTIKVFGGYRFNKHIALEGQYTDYAKIVYKSPIATSRTSTIEAESYSIAANVGYKFSFGLRPFLVAGAGRIKLKRDGFYHNQGAEEVLYRFGGGVEYTPPAMSELTLKLAYERDNFELEHHSGDEAYNIASTYFGVSYNF